MSRFANALDSAYFPFNGKEALDRLGGRLRASLDAWRSASKFKHPMCDENTRLLCWLLKDLGWVLLCSPLAWPAAMVAITLQALEVAHQWSFAAVDEWVHSVAILAWLVGNSMWMSAQLLFEPDLHKGRASPWYSGAIFQPSADAYHLGRFAMQAIHTATIIGLVSFYIVSAKKSLLPRFKSESSAATSSVSSPTGALLRHRKASLGHMPREMDCIDADALIFGVLTPEVYSKVFILPWILKDLFWSSEHYIAAMVCMILVTVLMADYFWLFMKCKNLAALLWTTGSAVWISNDLVMHEQEMWPLLLSILFFAVGACMLATSVISEPRECEPRQMAPEYNPLL